MLPGEMVSLAGQHLALYVLAVFHAHLLIIRSPFKEIPAMPRNEFTREQVRAQASDAVGGDQIKYRLTEAGEPFTIEHPLFRSKEIEDALEPLEDDDAEGIAQVLLGDQFERYQAEGGTPEELSRLLFVVGLQMRDTVQGRPTRSSTSSGNTQKRSKPRS